MITELVRTLRQPDFPYKAGHKPMPFVLHTMFWVGFWMPIGAGVFVGLRLLAGDHVKLYVLDQDVAWDDRFLSAGVVASFVAAVGIALAYGVWAERTYPRHLSIVVLAAGALWANVRMFQTLNLSWAPIAVLIVAIGSIRYLLVNADVREYYRHSPEETVAGFDTVSTFRHVQGATLRSIASNDTSCDVGDIAPPQ
jgi:hypothetical protein